MRMERKRDFILSVKIILGLMAIMAAGIGCGYLALVEDLI